MSKSPENRATSTYVPLILLGSDSGPMCRLHCTDHDTIKFLVVYIVYHLAVRFAARPRRYQLHLPALQFLSTTTRPEIFQINRQLVRTESKDYAVSLVAGEHIPEGLDSGLQSPSNGSLVLSSHNVKLATCSGFISPDRL